MTDSYDNEFGKWLKQAREDQHLTREELAIRVGIHLETIRKIEAGTRRASPQVTELIRRVLDVPEQDKPD